MPRVLVINGDRKIGEMITPAAIKLAKEQGKDLVEISPDSNPPVCRIIDYGKFKYDLKKKEKARRANQTKVQTKEMKFRPQTDNHDVKVKCKHIRRFIEEGNRCLLVVTFKGRERQHPEVAENLLLGVAEILEDVADISLSPNLDGNKMTMMLVPAKERPSGDGKQA